MDVELVEDVVEVVPSVPQRELPATITHPDVSGGMIPKLRAAQTALEGGVGRVVIATWSGPGTLEALLAGHGTGTHFIADATDTETAHV